MENNLLVEAELLYDIDLGLIRYIRDNLADPAFFDTDILALPDESIIGLLQLREDQNPLSIIFNEDIDKESQDNIYKEIMQQYGKIIYEEYTESTPIVDFISLCIRTNSVNKISVICDTHIYDLSDEICKTISDSFNNKISVKYKESKDVKFPLDEYDALYLKYAYNIIHYDKIESKNIYVADLHCNLDSDLLEHGERIPKPEVFFSFAEENEFRLISMYEYEDDNYPKG